MVKKPVDKISGKIPHEKKNQIHIFELIDILL